MKPLSSLPFLPVHMTLVSQNLPVATLYGDVQIRFADWVRHLTHYDPSKWTCTSESAEEKVTVSLQSRVEIIRSEHVRFISDLARYNNEVGLSLSLSLSLSLFPSPSPQNIY